jgi:hypothetical protein
MLGSVGMLQFCKSTNLLSIRNQESCFFNESKTQLERGCCILFFVADLGGFWRIEADFLNPPKSAKIRQSVKIVFIVDMREERQSENDDFSDWK